jgi:multicomponent Na+:H+ antiporter subunit D
MLIPPAGAALIVFSRKHPLVRDTLAVVTAGMQFAAVVLLFPTVSGGANLTLVVAEPLPGLELKLIPGIPGMLFALLASLLWVVTAVYSVGYMRAMQERHLARFYSCFALSLWAAMGMAFSGNLLTLFIFYEMLTLATYPLVTHSGTERAKRSGRLYLGLLLGTSVCLLLLAVIWTWLLAGTLDFTEGGILRDTTSPLTLGALLVLYVFGVGKAALMPFHRWLPAAMVAPTPVSALLHAVAVVKGGVFFLLMVALYVFGIQLLAELTATQWLRYVAAATILLAALVALRQDNLKLRLAYSTISQLGYIVLGILLATSAGVSGASMHMVMHAFGKITLFFCAGAILVATQKTDISQMRGLGHSMPFTMIAFFIGTLSIIGIPPAGGTWSKWFLLLGTLESGQLLLMVVLMAGSLLSALYLLPIPARAFFATPAAVDTEHRAVAVPTACSLAIGVTAAGCLLLFFYADAVYAMVSLFAGGNHGE